MAQEPTPADLCESAMNQFSRGNGIEAARQLQWALIGNPDYGEAWHNRAMVLRALNDPFDALLCCDKAIFLNPGCAAYYNTKGVCWASLSQFGSAKDQFKAAIDLDPNLSAAWLNMSNALKLNSELSKAVIAARNAVILAPGNADYHMNLAAALLRSGDYLDGFTEYEWRHKTNDAFHRHMPLPIWEMEHSTVRADGVVLYAEQGHGDAIQFLRFAPMLKASYPDVSVYVEVKRPMHRIAATLRGIDGVIAYGDPLPQGATHCLPLMSVPHFLGIAEESDIWMEAPYLYPPPAGPDIVPDNGKLKVGLCWRTGVRPYQPELKSFAENKSIDQHFLGPLFKVEGVEWHSLQVPLPEKLDIGPIEQHELHDFMDTAALMRQLDLVVSVDTSVAHLAGAIGAECYVLTPFDNCWRWNGTRKTSPWYPTVEHIRQPAPGDWPSVIARICSEVARFT